jgi:hypothetical protein
MKTWRSFARRGPVSDNLRAIFVFLRFRCWPSRLVATAEEDRLSFSAANKGQEGKSPGSEAGARLGFVCHGITRDESEGNGYPAFSTTCIFWTTSEV